MMANEFHVSMQLNDQEQEVVEMLKDEMHLASTDDVIRLLVRQEAQRKAVVCPTCGHLARKAATDVANCNSCLSVINLSEGIWEVVQMQRRP
ncbi:hypothetical protein [Candidatus Amarolinea dominans]|jgi:uncharacterized CHY-type Zn-finger protein|uniref:hypothetical protein n=2 Tax=Candidatus Amarolinea dominans TaxID=3140696 RepID=UPI0031354EC1|nr:hypothetical protein [Anaerolineae bacterium]